MYYPSPPSPAGEFILEEEGGVTLTLKDRFLPYRPMRIEGRQRAEFTWYPGSPEATVQMLGPEEGSIRLNGYWKDRFLQVGQSAVAALDLKRVMAGNFPADLLTISTSADLVSLVDTMRRMGRRITLKWQGLTRVGHIVSFAHTWHNIHDCEWELEFAVLSQGEDTVPTVEAIPPSLPDAYQVALKTALEIRQKIIEASGLPQWVSKTTTLNLALEGAQLLIAATAGAIGDVASGYANGVISLSQGGRRTVAAFTGALSGLNTQLSTIADSATNELYSWGIYGSMDNAPAGVVVAAASKTRQLSNFLRDNRYAYAVEQRALAQQTADNAAQVRSYTAPANTDLRIISRQFYGTQDYWRQLMTYNNLTSNVVPTGRTIAIPLASALKSNQLKG